MADTKFDLEHADKKVVFSFTDCSTKKKYSFYQLSRQQAKTLLDRLSHVEKLTWKQLANMGRKDGLTPEDPNNPNFNLIDNENSSVKKLTEKHYFHLRVERQGLFRVFGYQQGRHFCITHIDPEGKINH